MLLNIYKPYLTSVHLIGILKNIWQFEQALLCKYKLSPLCLKHGNSITYYALLVSLVSSQQTGAEIKSSFRSSLVNLSWIVIICLLDIQLLSLVETLSELYPRPPNSLNRQVLQNVKWIFFCKTLDQSAFS